MSDAVSGRRDFFVSFNSADRDWAEWIAAELEANGYTTYYQHWDFRPGNNFVLEMQRPRRSPNARSRCFRRTI
jgi:hypothetical protein